MYNFKRKIHVHDLPDFGKVYLLEPTQGIRDAFLAKTKTVNEQDPFELQKWLLDETLCDEQGNLVHANSDEFPGEFIDAYFDVALKVIGGKLEKKETGSPIVSP